MNKVKIEVPNGEWGSLNTKYPSDSDRVADNEFTAGTANVDTSVKGVLTKRLGGVDYASLGGAAKDQYEAIFSDGVRHLLTVVGGTLKYTSGDGQVHNIISGLTATVNNEFATTQDRVYFGNGVQKKTYDRVTSYGGVTYTFPTQTVKNIGAIAPTTAPTAALVVDATIDQVPAGVHKYKVTFVYYDSEESNGGTASNSVTNDAAHTSNALTSVPVGGYGVTARKIYRDNNDDLFYLVGVILNNTATTFTDNLKIPTTALPDDNSLPPDFTLINLYLDRLFLAGVPGDPYFIFYSEPGFPDIFPSTNYIPCNQEDPITGMVVYLDRLIVFNRRSMGQLLGRTSDQFRYAQIEGSVGCVDNRSIQIRVLNGVPVLIWLSDKGFYAYNGNSVVYISDKIEDQVNFNIQQSVIQKNKITHSDYTIFTQGTKTDGINLESAPGSITTKGPYWDTVAHPSATYEEQTNPKKLWDTKAEWENGSYKHAVDTNNLSGSLSGIPKFSPDLSTGTFNNTMHSGGTLRIPSSTPFNGETSTSGSVFTWPRSQPSAIEGYNYLAVAIIPARSGSVSTASFKVTSAIFGTSSGKVQIYSNDPINNKPQTLLSTSNTDLRCTKDVVSQVATFSTPFLLTGGTKYWLVFKSNYSNGDFKNIRTGTPLSGNNNLNKERYWSGATILETDWRNIDNLTPWCSYTFNYTGNTASGSWLSPIYDSKCTNWNTSLQYSVISNSIIWYYAWTTVNVEVLGSNNALFTTYSVLSNSFGDQQYGVKNYNFQNYRYYRFRITLSTTDDVYSATLSDIQLLFHTGTWESEVIDTTSDSTVYSAFTINSTSPSGTSITYQIATSASPSGPWTYVNFGSHVVRQYVKIKAVLNPNTTEVLVPTLHSLLFKYYIESEFISKSIDTGVAPSGWDIFQASFELNGGTVVYSMRSAATEVGLASASWYAVTNGEFPTSTLPVYQWVQWKAEVTSNPDQVPVIDSITINWFVGSATQSIRCASLFYNTNYYLAAAEFGNTSNNLLFIFDQEGKWRVYRNLSVATMSYFFNNPYYCDAVTNKIVKFLQGTSDSGANISFEFRSKAFDFSADENFDDKVKILEKCILSGRNTGATYSIEYSVDGGDTFYPLKDKNGNSSFTTAEDDKGFYKWLRPDFTTNIPSGYSVILRIYNNDMKEVEIDGFKLTAIVRKHDPID